MRLYSYLDSSDLLRMEGPCWNIKVHKVVTVSLNMTMGVHKRCATCPIRRRST